MSIFNGKAEDIFNKKSDYPIGSICMFKADINPNKLYGGTWVRIKGRFILGADDSIYRLGSEGGEATHKLTVDEMPSHNHTINNRQGAQVGEYWNTPPTTSKDGGTLQKDVSSVVNYAGGGKSHNNMPPYVALYIWTKVAESYVI